MTGLMQILGRTLIAIALIVIPLSMSHASTGSHVSSMQQTDHSTMEDGHQHQVDMNHHQHSDRTSHKAHDDAGCCSSICSVAMTIGSEYSLCTPVTRLRLAYGVKSLESGEWVPPFRPPSI